MMNKTGPNFLKSTREIGLDESLESEIMDEMHSYQHEQPTSISRRQGSGFPAMPSISSAGIPTGRLDP